MEKCVLKTPPPLSRTITHEPGGTNSWALEHKLLRPRAFQRAQERRNMTTRSISLSRSIPNRILASLLDWLFKWIMRYKMDIDTWGNTRWQTKPILKVLIILDKWLDWLIYFLKKINSNISGGYIGSHTPLAQHGSVDRACAVWKCPRRCCSRCYHRCNRRSLQCSRRPGRKSFRKEHILTHSL